jgi:branched-subunit amino acid transport protein
MKIWQVTLILGTITLLWRTSFILWLSDWDPPEWFSKAMRFVPVAAFSAIVAPAVLRPDGVFEMAITNPRVIAALVSIFVAWRSKHLLITLVCGMGALWLMIWLLGG